MTGGDVLDVLVGVCLVLGGLLSLVAGIGLVRFPDVLSRTHAATKPQVLGVLLILLALAVSMRNGADLATLVLIGGFQLGTAPLAAQMIGRAAYRTGRVHQESLVVDELAEHKAGADRPD
ncbi:monovalent cation/H(+) antiporter subunit G [Plantactinospora endophytica]|uniref:Na+/H+ antiporter subunit G n=1 Tax=Plantactinospora endophytica TaxID=673535 RepID=A0ABQ4DW88_9ACTN|nr:monovalent cation/H(+) antiporter subunit G [Plantactinospora endophytica]GIG86720.1 Na+/H+ antiporter subunit G [Plantactinospora endophytica]